MMEHLDSEFEKFRHEVIEVNNNLENISDYYMKEDFIKYSESYKIQKMKEFLENQDRLNNLYRGIN